MKTKFKNRVEQKEVIRRPGVTIGDILRAKQNSKNDDGDEPDVEIKEKEFFRLELDPLKNGKGEFGLWETGGYSNRKSKSIAVAGPLFEPLRAISVHRGSFLFPLKENGFVCRINEIPFSMLSRSIKENKINDLYLRRDFERFMLIQIYIADHEHIKTIKSVVANEDEDETILSATEDSLFYATVIPKENLIEWIEEGGKKRFILREDSIRDFVSKEFNDADLHLNVNLSKSVLHQRVSNFIIGALRRSIFYRDNERMVHPKPFYGSYSKNPKFRTDKNNLKPSNKKKFYSSKSKPN